jgi:hypothetical protein
MVSTCLHLQAVEEDTACICIIEGRWRDCKAADLTRIRDYNSLIPDMRLL